MAQSMAEYVAGSAAAEAAERARNETGRNILKIVLTARFGEIPPEVEAAIDKAVFETLNAWLRVAATAHTLDEVGIVSNGQN